MLLKFYSVSVLGLNNHFLTLAKNAIHAKGQVLEDLASMGVHEIPGNLDAKPVDIDQSNSPHFS